MAQTMAVVTASGTVEVEVDARVTLTLVISLYFSLEI